MPDGKTPLTQHGYLDASDQPEQISKWAAKWPNANVGLVPGGDLTILDVEAPDVPSIPEFHKQYGAIPLTFTVQTWSCGRHYYLNGRHIKPFKGFAIDVIGRRGMAPGSVVKGKAYEIIHDVDFADAPAWLTPALNAKMEARRNAAPDAQQDHPAAIDRAKVFLKDRAKPTEGQRNDETFKVVCILKDWGLGKLTILELLEDYWGTHPQLDDDELGAIVDSAFKNGQNAPGCDAPRPMAEVFKDVEAPHETRASRLVSRRGSDLTPKQIGWMWRDRFPRAMLSLIAGHGGLGKTTVLLDMAARITRGSPWPDGDGAAKRGSVIYFSGEDSIEHTLLPRFLAAMGDPERIHFIPAVKREDGEGVRTFHLQQDLRELEKHVAAIGDVELVIFDPISSYFGNTDTWRSTNVRTVLEPVAEMADRCGVTVLGNTHFTKSGKGTANMRVLDSVAITAVVRAIYTVIEDPETKGRRLFLPSKYNLVPPRDGLDFTISSTFVGEGVTGSFVKWGSVAVTQSADEALAAAEAKERPETAVDEAKAFNIGPACGGPQARC